MKVMVVSVHKLEQELHDDVEQRFPNAESSFTTLYELKNGGVKALIKTFAGFHRYDNIVFVYNEENYKMLRPLFLTLSLLTRKWKIIEIYNSGKSSTASLLARAVAPVKMTISAIETQFQLRRVSRDLSNIPAKNTKALHKESLVYYLKTNLSFGIKAGGSLGHISGVFNGLCDRAEAEYISAETPVMLTDASVKHHIALDDVVYTVPYELNTLKVNREFINQTEKIMKDRMPDCIYQRLTLYNYSGAFLANQNAVPLIVEYNGSEVWIQKNWSKGLKYAKVAEAIEEYVLHSADVVVTVSEVLKEELLERQVPAEKIVCYPNCIDEKVYNYKLYEDAEKRGLRERLGFEEEDLVFTFIGTFGMWHGVEFLAEAIVEMVDKYSDMLLQKRVKFLLIGDGLLGEKVRAMLQQAPYDGFVQFTGLIPQHEAPRYLAVSDAFLSPHIRQEGKFIGSPTKLFEYMAFAKPIIASNLDQVGEVFEEKLFADALPSSDIKLEKESAVIFEPNSHQQFIQSILFAAENYADIEKLGGNAYDLVMQKYTWQIHVDKIIEKFNEIAS
jgi:glycosyltransferase involved in cell wall biosynthesis